jgi:hypothetical protein
LSPVQNDWSEVNLISAEGMLTSLVEAVVKGDKESKTDNTCNSSPFGITVSIVLNSGKIDSQAS